MMFRRIIATIVLLVSVSLIHAQKKPTLAVLEFRGSGIPLSEIQSFTNRLRANFMELDDYHIIQRSNMWRVLRQHNLPINTCFSEDCLIQEGKILGAHLIVNGVVHRSSSSWIAEVSVTEIATRKIIGSGSFEFDGFRVKEILDDLDVISNEFAKHTLADLSEESRNAKGIAWAFITTEPAEAIISINSITYGKDRNRIVEFEGGKLVNLSIALDGYLTYDTTFISKIGELVYVDHELLLETGYVNFLGSNGALVFMETKQIGYIPLWDHEVTVGKRKYQVFKPGFYKIESYVDIEFGKTTVVSPQLIPKPKNRAIVWSILFPGAGQIYLNNFKGYVLAYSSVSAILLGYMAHKRFIDREHIYNAALFKYNTALVPAEGIRLRKMVELEYVHMEREYDIRREYMAILATLWTISVVDIVF